MWGGREGKMRENRIIKNNKGMTKTFIEKQW